jgi:hypothetical protein
MVHSLLKILRPPFEKCHIMSRSFGRRDKVQTQSVMHRLSLARWPRLPTHQRSLFPTASSYHRWPFHRRLSEYDRHRRGITSTEAWRAPAPIPQITHTLAPGTSSFIRLAESHIFVDKTYAITEFLQGGVQPVHLVLRGRRSGKTTLLRLFQ